MDLHKYNKKFNINKLLLFILTMAVTLVVITLLVLSIIVLKKHDSHTVMNIEIVTGPTMLISLLALIPSIALVIIMTWLIYCLFKDGFKDMFKGVTTINIIDISLYVVMIAMIITSLVAIVIGFSDWNQIIMIK